MAENTLTERREPLLSDALALFRRYQREHEEKAANLAHEDAAKSGASFEKARTNKLIADRIANFLAAPPVAPAEPVAEEGRTAERKAFESYIVTMFGPRGRAVLKRNAEGDYLSDAGAFAWKAWLRSAVGGRWRVTPAQPSTVAAEGATLTVWYGEMPESNGRRNWTAMLHRKDADGFDKFTQGFIFARSEYPDRVRYEADRMAWLIGEKADEPDLLAYDADLHSGYVAPPAPSPVTPEKEADRPAEAGPPWRGDLAEALAMTDCAALDELTEDAIRSKAKALLKHMGWRAKDKPGWHSVIELMTRFGLECRKVADRCAYPACGCDRDAVCAVAVERIEAAALGREERAG